MAQLLQLPPGLQCLAGVALTSPIERPPFASRFLSRCVDVCVPLLFLSLWVIEFFKFLRWSSLTFYEWKNEVWTKFRRCPLMTFAWTSLMCWKQASLPWACGDHQGGCRREGLCAVWGTPVTTYICAGPGGWECALQSLGSCTFNLPYTESLFAL